MRYSTLLALADLRNPFFVFTYALLWGSACHHSQTSQNQPQVSDAQHTHVSSAHGVRLPADVVPIAYTLHLNVDPTLPTFSAEATIRLQAAGRQTVEMHAQDLKVHTITAHDLQNQAVGVKAWAYSQTHPDRLVIDFEQPMHAEIQLKIDYTAPFAKDLVGLYRYQTEDRWYAATQFEAIHARQMFPCFDEPSFKTPFDISITAPSSMKVFANTPQVDQKPNKDATIYRFATTKPLPTYLVAIAVGDFDVVEANAIATSPQRSKPIALRGIAPKGSGHLLKTLLEETGPIMHAFEDYLGVAYPYEKLDLYAVDQFRAGAMENPGLITFTPWLSLLDKDASEEQLYWTRLVLAHELAHQWFGNSVTLQWWDDLWLNEAFATFLSSEVMHKLMPDAGFDERFHLDRIDAFKADSLSTARQIRQPIQTQGDIDNAFDDITYTKGAQVIAAFADAAGETKFRAGLQNYLERHAHLSVSSKEFFATMTQALEPSWETDFRTYTDQPGLPFLSLDLQCSLDRNLLSVSQKRYLPIGSKHKGPAQTWTIPLCIDIGDGKQREQVCTQITESISDIELAMCPTWITPSAQKRVYYRYVIPESLWSQSWQHAGGGMATQSFVDSLAAAVRLGDASMAGLIRHGAQWTQNLEAAHSLISTWTWIDQRILNDEERRPFRQKVVAWYRPHLTALTQLKKRNALQQTIWSDMYHLLALNMGDDVVRSKLLKHVPALMTAFKTWDANAKADVFDGVHLDPDLWSLALAVGVQEDPASIAQLLPLFETSSALPPAKRSVLTEALPHVQEEARFKEVLASSLQESRMKPHEIARFLLKATSNAPMSPQLWQWAIENREALFMRTPGHHAARLFTLASSVCTAQSAKELDTFFKPLSAEITGGKRDYLKAEEALRQCLAGRQHHQEAVKQAIKRL